MYSSNFELYINYIERLVLDLSKVMLNIKLENILGDVN